MVWALVVVVGICAGFAVYFGFKAAEMPQEEKEKRLYYIKITALLAGISMALQSLLLVALAK